MAKIGLAIVSLTCCFILLELVLRTGVLGDNINNSRITWRPQKYKQVTDEINFCHQLFSKNDPYGFTDIPRSMEKKKGTYRIMVLGDSFIWGFGVLPETVWSRKLERKFQNEFNNIEVFSWGKPGWSTIDEFNFFKSEGYKYKPDMVIFGFDESDVNLTPQTIRPPTFPILYFLMTARNFFSNTIEYLVSHTNQNYDLWLDTAYSEANLKKYKELLYEVSAFTSSNKTDLLFVITPNSYDKKLGELYDKVIPLFKERGISYLNLYPGVVANFSEIPVKQLWASPADPHPGEQLTTFYAESVYKYLISHENFSNYR